MTLSLADVGLIGAWLLLAAWVLYAILKPVAEWLSVRMPSRLPEEEVRDYTEIRAVPPLVQLIKEAAYRDEVVRALYGPTYHEPNE